LISPERGGEDSKSIIMEEDDGTGKFRVVIGGREQEDDSLSR
jgi:hypothetical protein